MVSMTVRPSLTETSLMSVSGFLQFSSGSYTLVRFTVLTAGVAASAWSSAQRSHHGRVSASLPSWEYS